MIAAALVVGYIAGVATIITLDIIDLVRKGPDR